MPTQAKADRVLGALAEAGEPLSVAALEARVDIRRSPLELLLKVLAVDGAVESVPGGWRSTGQPWAYDALRYERVAEARQGEQQAMLAYERGDRCRMEFLTDALDDPDSRPCGRCDVCTGPWYPTGVGESSVRQAAQVLDRVGVVLEPRKLWPAGLDQLRVSADGAAVKGKISLDDLATPGGWLAGLGAASTFLGLVTLAIPESGQPSASTENVDRPLCKSSRVGVRRSAVLPGWVVGGWLLASKVLLRSLDPSRPRGSLTSESPVLHACKSTRRSVAALARRRQ